MLYPGAIVYVQCCESNCVQAPPPPCDILPIRLEQQTYRPQTCVLGKTKLAYALAYIMRASAVYDASLAENTTRRQRQPQVHAEQTHPTTPIATHPANRLTSAHAWRRTLLRHRWGSSTKSPASISTHDA